MEDTARKTKKFAIYRPQDDAIISRSHGIDVSGKAAMPSYLKVYLNGIQQFCFETHGEFTNNLPIPSFIPDGLLVVSFNFCTGGSCDDSKRERIASTIVRKVKVTNA